MSDVARARRRDLELYDPDKGLKTIAVAEAAEKHWARAKDCERLFEAIELKLTAQREYVTWRASVVRPGGDGSNQHKRANISVRKELLPESDPGHVVAHRWRKKLKTDEAFAIALADAQHRCQRICEQEAIGTVRGTEGTGEFELYTPPEYIAAARDVLGAIDLDPEAKIARLEGKLDLILSKIDARFDVFNTELGGKFRAF